MRVLKALLFFSASLITNQCLANCLLGPNHFDNIIVLFDKLSETTHFERVSYFEGGELIEVGTITQMESTQVKLLKLSAEKAHDQIHIFTADLSEKTFGFYQFIDGIRHDPEPIVGQFNSDSCSIRFEEEKDVATLDIEVTESGVLVTGRERASTDEPYKIGLTIHYRIGDGKS